ncbi:MAG: sugar ABC transporter ATP-binding protein [Planctomycetota bacterium]
MVEPGLSPHRPDDSRSPFLEVQGLSKSFGGVRALRNVSLEIARGECHGLVGENGAGKSTLGRILAGIHRADMGTIRLGGREFSFRSPADAAGRGIGMVHQELAFCPDLSVAENLCLGRYPRRAGVFLDRRRMLAQAQRLLARIGVALDLRQPLRGLSTGQEQLVQIAQALGTGAELLIFDEPTSSLSDTEAARLFRLLDELKKASVTILYVSHRLPELFRLADRITVLRDGEVAGSVASNETSEDELVQLMIGRSLRDYFPRHLARARDELLLRVRRLSSPGRFREVSLDLHAGEILGIAGLVGAGRSELAQAIFGLDDRARGVVELEGRRVATVDDAMQNGLALVPEDRKRQGLVLGMAGVQNISLSILGRLRRFLLLDHRRARAIAARLYQELDVRAPSIDTAACALSGGNQQKVVLAKWLARNARVLIVDEPTRGVDVGAKAAIHALLCELAEKGLGILLVSSELPELLHLSTRILVMRGGRLVAEVRREDADSELLLRHMAGVGRE